MADPIDELRDVVTRTPSAPAELEAYLAKVRERAYTITDSDVDTLKQRVDEDVIFEQTVAAAIDEGLRRLDIAGGIIE